MSGSAKELACSRRGKTAGRGNSTVPPVNTPLHFSEYTGAKNA